eukprot:1585464-Prymnesium_polylepis.1
MAGSYVYSLPTSEPSANGCLYRVVQPSEREASDSPPCPRTTSVSWHVTHAYTCKAGAAPRSRKAGPQVGGPSGVDGRALAARPLHPVDSGPL